MINDKLKKYIFYFSYTLFVINYVFSTVPSIKPITNFFPKISFLLLLFLYIINYKKNSKKEIIESIIVLLLSLIIYLFSGDNIFLMLSLLIINSKIINFNFFIKYDIIQKILLLFVIIIFWKLGLCNNYISYRNNIFVGISFGFYHPNIFSMYMFSILIEYLYLKIEKLKLLKFILIILIIIFIKFSSESRTIFLSFTILLILLIIFKYTKLKNINLKKYKFIIKLFPIIFLLFTFIIIFIYIKFDCQKLNNLLSYRLYLYSKNINNYNINLFGNKIIFTKAKRTIIYSNVLDNSYLFLILKYGICGFGLLYYYILKIISNIDKNKDYKLFIFLFVIFILSFFENYLFSYVLNIFLLYNTKNKNQI